MLSDKQVQNEDLNGFLYTSQLGFRNITASSRNVFKTRTGSGQGEVQGIILHQECLQTIAGTTGHQPHGRTFCLFSSEITAPPHSPDLLPHSVSVASLLCILQKSVSMSVATSEPLQGVYSVSFSHCRLLARIDRTKGSKKALHHHTQNTRNKRPLVHHRNSPPCTLD